MSLADVLLPMEVAEELAQLLELPDSVMYGIANAAYKVFGPACDAFDAAVKENFPAIYTESMAYLKTHEHPFAKRLPYLEPTHVVFSMLCYFGLILATAIIGKIVGKRSYKSLGIVHNLFLHLASLYMCGGLLVSARAAGYSLWNNAAGTTEKEFRVAKFIWLFYVSKVPEWIDTALMLLKHNYRQVTFLHVYHHVSIYAIWWLASFKAPGGEAYYSAMVNSGIHVFMYGYYFLTMSFPTGPVRTVLNRFKFIITKSQMTQFFFNCLQSAYDLLIIPADELRFSRGLMWLLFWYMISLLALFGNFLVRNRNQPRVVYSPYSSPVSSPVTTNGSNGHGGKDIHNSRTNGNGHANGNGSANGKGDANGIGADESHGWKRGTTKAQLREITKNMSQRKKQ